MKPSEPKRYDKQNAIQKSPILNRVLSGATSELIKESVSRLYQPKPRQEIDVATSKLTSERVS